MIKVGDQSVNKELKSCFVGVGGDNKSVRRIYNGNAGLNKCSYLKLTATPNNLGGRRGLLTQGGGTVDDINVLQFQLYGMGNGISFAPDNQLIFVGDTLDQLNFRKVIIKRHDNQETKEFSVIDKIFDGDFTIYLFPDEAYVSQPFFSYESIGKIHDIIMM